ncbi:Dimerisation domain-containing protein [Enhydrobacter aerosaccus]|uniref:Dimerisation domain-containing protein n=1 Tax=Enhydrobacter aerosaccus TaxID=225324 RepID=A0A1T4K7C9_9HYPH|nr:methyltransferase [Enhydrobacter aerosaccus]SJZ38334.1 Dimerisation domain-containing protein [Enhydrobacter aerosaccus]
MSDAAQAPASLTMTAKSRLDTTRLQKMAQAYWESAALMAAVELEVFTAIARGHDTTAAVAKTVGISERNAERLLTALVAMALLTRESASKDSRFANAPDVQRFLVKDSDRYAGPWILFTKPRWAAYGELSERLRNPVVKKLGAYDQFTIEDARRYHAATYSIGMGAARLFSRSVDLSGRKLMLDLGGGSGAYSIVATQTFPGLKAIVLDLPPVTVVAKEYIEANKASDRVTTLAGDFTVTDFPQGVDVVVMASNLPQYEPALIRLVVGKAFAALVPGGEMHLIGETLNDDRRGPLSAALWGLNEGVFGSTGLAHTEAEVKGYLEEAGFRGVAVHPFVPGVLSRVAGRKPA